MSTLSKHLNKLPNLLKLLILPIIIMLTLTACNKYPEANMPNEPLEQPLDIVKEPKIVAMTNNMTVAVKADGTLWTWGSGNLLREVKSPEEGYTPGQVEGVADAVAVSASGSHVLVLMKDGTVWGWGKNDKGQVDPNKKDRKYIQELSMVYGDLKIKEILASGRTSYLITEIGDVLVFGETNYLKKYNTSKNIAKIDGLNNIVKVDGYMDYLLALDESGYLYVSDLSDFEDDSEEIEHIIRKIDFEIKVVDFSSGFGNFALLSDGSLYSWGDKNWATQGEESPNIITKPTKVNGLSKVVKVNDISAITTDGDLYTWGQYFEKCITCISTGLNKVNIRNPVKIASNLNIKSFLHGKYQTGFVDIEGDFYIWGFYESGQDGNGFEPKSPDRTLKNILSIRKSNWNYYPTNQN